MENQILYKEGMRPEELANVVLKEAFGSEKPSLPINPFYLMRHFGIIYQFMDFKGLEGIYIVPENENDIAFVGINVNRPITRQRYTAGHELCHHIKDRTSEICSINSNENIEKYAEKFAAELLMPSDMLRDEVNKYLKDGKVTLNDVLLIAEKFGVSFRACTYRIAYKLQCLDGDTDAKTLKSRIEKYKPNAKKEQMGLEIENTLLLRQVFDNYEFFYQIKEEAFWYRFEADFIYNENRMEGVQISREEVDEILADLRINKQNCTFCKEPYQNIIEVLGHSDIYNFIAKTEKRPNIYSILTVNKELFKYAPYPDAAGKTRTTNNNISGAAIGTVDCNQIVMEMYKLDEPIKKLVEAPSGYTASEYLNETIRIHHRITQIHPFNDGNGRSARALMNWMLKLKGIPPFYISLADKDVYYDALQKADTDHNYSYLLKLFIREIIKTSIRINKKR